MDKIFLMMLKLKNTNFTNIKKPYFDTQYKY